MGFTHVQSCQSSWRALSSFPQPWFSRAVDPSPHQLGPCSPAAAHPPSCVPCPFRHPTPTGGALCCSVTPSFTSCLEVHPAVAVQSSVLGSLNNAVLCMCPTCLPITGWWHCGFLCCCEHRCGRVLLAPPRRGCGSVVTRCLASGGPARRFPTEAAVPGVAVSPHPYRTVTWPPALTVAH